MAPEPGALQIIPLKSLQLAFSRANRNIQLRRALNQFEFFTPASYFQSIRVFQLLHTLTLNQLEFFGSCKLLAQQIGLEAALLISEVPSPDTSVTILSKLFEMGIPGEIHYKLNSGTVIPALGNGTVAISETDEEAKKGTLNAFKAGYRHFDTASKYATEKSLGLCLEEVFKSGLCKREEVFVTTKIWCNDMSPGQVPVAFHRSLRNLGLEYVDLYLIHFPFRVKPEADTEALKEEDVLPLDLKGVWLELEKLKEQGLTKAIGVSNFSVKRLQEMFALTGTYPAVNQVELHPLFQQKKLLDYCKRKGIHVTAYSPLGAPGQIYSDKSRSVLEHPVLTEIASKHGKSTAQISLRWIIEQGASVVGKSYNEKRLAQNADIFSWSLDKEDLEKISGIKNQFKFVANSFVYKGQYKTFEEFYDDSEE